MGPPMERETVDRGTVRVRVRKAESEPPHPPRCRRRVRTRVVAGSATRLFPRTRPTPAGHPFPDCPPLTPTDPERPSLVGSNEHDRVEDGSGLFRQRRIDRFGLGPLPSAPDRYIGSSRSQRAGRSGRPLGRFRARAQSSTSVSTGCSTPRGCRKFRCRKRARRRRPRRSDRTRTRSSHPRRPRPGGCLPLTSAPSSRRRTLQPSDRPARARPATRMRPSRHAWQAKKARRPPDPSGSFVLGFPRLAPSVDQPSGTVTSKGTG